MRRRWNEIKSHWPSAALFLLYWLCVFGLHVFRWNAPPDRPEDMVRPVTDLHFLLPVIAGAMVSWWRRYGTGGIAAGMLAGAAVIVADSAAVLTHQLIAFHLGESGGSERISELPVFLIAIGLLGSLLALLGAVGATGFGHLLNRRQKPGATLFSPLAGQRAADSGGAAASQPLEATAGIIPRCLLWVAGGLVVATAVIVLFGVIPALAADSIAVTSPKAVPAFAVNAILNLLTGIALFVRVSGRSGGAGKVLVVLAGFVSLLLGFTLLDAASALTAHGPTGLWAAAACLTGAAGDLGAGIVAIVAACRRHKHWGDPQGAQCDTVPPTI